MKNLLILITIMLVGGCAATPTVQSVLGTYELKKDGLTFRGIFLENGIVEFYNDGEKEEDDGKWSLFKDGELHILNEDGIIFVFRINPNRSINGPIASIDKDGKRTDLPKDKQLTFKRIK